MTFLDLEAHSDIYSSLDEDLDVEGDFEFGAAVS